MSIEWDKGKPPTINPAAFEKRWRNRYVGQRCAMLMDGPSLPDAEALKRIDCTVIGTNRSYKRCSPDIYVIVDPRLTREIGSVLPELTPNAVLRMSAYGASGVIVPKTVRWMGKARENGYHFSTDIANDGWVLCCVMPCAVQLATYLGFKEIVFCGLDLHFKDGMHFYPGGTSHISYMEAQYQWLYLVRETLDEMGVRCINTSMNSAVRCFKLVRFNEVFP